MLFDPGALPGDDPQGQGASLSAGSGPILFDPGALPGDNPFAPPVFAPPGPVQPLRYTLRLNAPAVVTLAGPGYVRQGITQAGPYAAGIGLGIAQDGGLVPVDDLPHSVYVLTMPGISDPLPGLVAGLATAEWPLLRDGEAVTLPVGVTVRGAGGGPQSLPPNVLALIASRLGIAAAELDQGVLLLEYTFAAARLVSAWPCIGDPATLTYPDNLFFGGAVALVVAARLFGPLTTGELGKILKLTAADGDSVTYSAPPNVSPEGWLKEAQEFLYQVSCVKNSLDASSSSFNFFRAGNDHRSHRSCIVSSALYGAGLIGLLNYGLYPLLYGGGEAYYRGIYYGG